MTTLDDLIKDLERGLDAYARAYLTFREPRMDHETGKRYTLSVEDARANATLLLLRDKVPLPEVTRFRIHDILRIERAVEES